MKYELLQQDSPQYKRVVGIPWWSNAWEMGFPARGLGLIPGQGPKILHATTKTDAAK